MFRGPRLYKSSGQIEIQAWLDLWSGSILYLVGEWLSMLIETYSWQNYILSSNKFDIVYLICHRSIFHKSNHKIWEDKKANTLKYTAAHFNLEREHSILKQTYTVTLICRTSA